METFFKLLALCEGNLLVAGGFPSQRPMTWSLMFSFICVWPKVEQTMEMPSCSLICYCNVLSQQCHLGHNLKQDWQFHTKCSRNMMMLSNGNIFHVTGPLCGEFTGEFPAQKPVTRSFDVFFDLRLNKRLSKRTWGWSFEMPLHSLWCHCHEFQIIASSPRG